MSKDEELIQIGTCLIFRDVPHTTHSCCPALLGAGESRWDQSRPESPILKQHSMKQKTVFIASKKHTGQ